MFARLLLEQDLDPGGRLVQAHSEILDLAGQTFSLSFQHGRMLLRPEPLLPLLFELRPEPRGEGPDLRNPSFPLLKVLCAKGRLPAGFLEARLDARVLVLLSRIALMAPPMIALMDPGGGAIFSS